MLWFIVTMLSVLFAYWGDEYGTTFVNKKTKIVFRLLLVVTLSYITGLGGSISSDHEAYLWHYNDYAAHGIGSVIDSFKVNIFDDRRDNFEPLFGLLNVLCVKLGLTAVGFCLLVAIITNAFFVSVIFRFRLPYLAIILFLVSIDYFQEVNLVRQVLAASICAFSLKYFEEKKYLLFAGIVLVPTFIHTSATVFLILLLFIPMLKESKKDVLLLMLLILWLFSIMVAFGFIGINIGVLSSLSYYENYLSGIREGIAFDLIYNLCVFAFFFFSFAELKRKQLTVYAIVFILGCVFRNMAVQFYWFYRISFFFSFIYCCFVPNFFLQHGRTSNASKNSYSIPVILIATYYISILVRGYILQEPTSSLGTVMYNIDEIY